MVELHKLMDTPSIRELAKITDIRQRDMTLKNLTEWAEQRDKNQLVEALSPFWAISRGKPGPDTIDEAATGLSTDKYRLIGSPLGETIWKVLNENNDIKQSLTNVARQVALIQVNVDVKNRTINFKSNFFRDASFEFGYAGYRAGNKLGFKMSFK